MDRPRDEFFADSTFAPHQSRRVRDREPTNFVAEDPHRLAGADEVALDLEHLAQRLIDLPCGFEPLFKDRLLAKPGDNPRHVLGDSQCEVERFIVERPIGGQRIKMHKPLNRVSVADRSTDDALCVHTFERFETAGRGLFATNVHRKCAVSLPKRGVGKTIRDPVVRSVVRRPERHDPQVVRTRLTGPRRRLWQKQNRPDVRFHDIEQPAEHCHRQLLEVIRGDHVSHQAVQPREACSQSLFRLPFDVA